MSEILTEFIVVTSDIRTGTKRMSHFNTEEDALKFIGKAGETTSVERRPSGNTVVGGFTVERVFSLTEEGDTCMYEVTFRGKLCLEKASKGC